jgi:dihydropyrimidinase
LTVDIVLRGGRVVTTDGVRRADVAIDGETIAADGQRDELPDADAVVDASGTLVMPGVVDPHVHVDDPYSFDTYETASRAAAVGGITTIIDFAWQAWLGDLSIWDEPGTLMEAVERQKRKGEQSLIDFGLHTTITREDPEVFDEIPTVIEEGVTSFKIFTAYEIGISNGFIDRILNELSDTGAVAVFHTEDASVCNQLTEQLKAEGKNDPQYYPQARPDYAEAMAAENAVRMAKEAETKYYGIHTSCRKVAEVLDCNQEDGSLIRGETCTHYTALDERAYSEQGTLAIMAPPLRSPDDRDAMFEHLDHGSLSVVSTDHVAFKQADKEVENWWDSSFGVNSLQTTLPVFHDEAVNERGYSYPFLVSVMSTNPARTFGLENKGSLEPGKDADFVIFDPNETYTITAEDNASVADYSIYEGRDVTGRVEQTYLRGEKIADDGKITARPGYGEYIDREVPEWSE